VSEEPIEPQHVEQMNAIARALDDAFNGENKGEARKIGFVLLVFPFGEDPKGRCNYISNGSDRRDIVTLFREMIAKFEGQPDITGHA
jgi:hypothetical protein